MVRATVSLPAKDSAVSVPSRYFDQANSKDLPHVIGRQKTPWTSDGIFFDGKIDLLWPCVQFGLTTEIAYLQLSDVCPRAV